MITRFRLAPHERAAWCRAFRWFQRAYPLRSRGLAVDYADRRVRADLRGEIRALTAAERQLDLFGEACW